MSEKEKRNRQNMPDVPNCKNTSDDSLQPEGYDEQQLDRLSMLGPEILEQIKQGKPIAIHYFDSNTTVFYNKENIHLNQAQFSLFARTILPDLYEFQKKRRMNQRAIKLINPIG